MSKCAASTGSSGQWYLSIFVGLNGGKFEKQRKYLRETLNMIPPVTRSVNAIEYIDLSYDNGEACQLPDSRAQTSTASRAHSNTQVSKN